MNDLCLESPTGAQAALESSCVLSESCVLSDEEGLLESRTPVTAVAALLIAVVAGFIAYQQSPMVERDASAMGPARGNEAIISLASGRAETKAEAGAADSPFTALRRVLAGERW
jgi:hypothetical protein